MVISAHQRYLIHLKKAEDFEKLAAEATTILAKNAMLEVAREHRREAEAERRKYEASDG
jgi:hypothetical protein